ncbi:MAG: phosphoglycerate mutase [Chloroflexi bacterium]|nr:phosphoglycerate mutase [Chloroflexota bacterium]HCU81293.1 phosphoglycerate mutase [Chloroflexota bacterium]
MSIIDSLVKTNNTKIIMLVLDGLGGLPNDFNGKTELEQAVTPHLDNIAKEGVLGQVIPVQTGVTPGSGPAHLALFGYDPLNVDIGRGILEAYGVGMQVREKDVAIRGNFCTVDKNGIVTDRRAGRITDEMAKPLVKLLAEIKIDGLSIDIRHVNQYRFAMVLRGDGLSANLDDTDPQEIGVRTFDPKPNSESAKHTADLIKKWIVEARQVLGGYENANMVTLRGYSHNPGLKSFGERYQLSAGCVAVYPMYRGIARLVGMETIEFDGVSPVDQFSTGKRVINSNDYDFLFVHVKQTDSYGEDGNYDKKVNAIEEVDKAISTLMQANPDVLVVTGDHSTPSRMQAHSWHPVPFLLWAPETVRQDQANQFGETECLSGGLGTMHAKDIMSMILAHSGRLKKYGA